MVKFAGALTVFFTLVALNTGIQFVPHSTDLSYTHPYANPWASLYYNPYANPFAYPLQQAYPTPTYTIQTLPGIAEEASSGPKFYPYRKGNKTEIEEEETVKPVLYASRLGARNLDLCYYLGNDIFSSHVACNENWADGTSEGVRKYINELTYNTNKLLGENNLKLSWKGPFARHDADERYPTNPSLDTTALFSKSCDAVIFLVFNQFTADCKTAVDGHKYAGVNKGGMCESQTGSGYAVVVDQGYIEDIWTGPQILAHHLLRMLIADLPDNEKTCPETTSLLHASLYPGVQKVDQCVVDKLNKSKVSLRPCMQNKF